MTALQRDTHFFWQLREFASYKAPRNDVVNCLRGLMIWGGGEGGEEGERRRGRGGTSGCGMKSLV